jgi:ketopantoate reductase
MCPEETECVALFRAAMDGDDLEIGSPWLSLPPARLAGKLFGSARAVGLSTHKHRDTRGVLYSLLLVRLLDLPAALCNTTVEALLSAEEGRRVAGAVIEEGVRVIDKLGIALERLPRQDPLEIVRTIRHRPENLTAARYRPATGYPELLQAIHWGLDTRPMVPQRGLIQCAADLGVAVDWNRRLGAALGRVLRTGFYRGPLDLLRAVA